MARKKTKKEEAKEEIPIEKPKARAKAKTSKAQASKPKTPSKKKGKLTVSQRERDEIDAVVDAIWAFVSKVKDAPRHLMVIGLFITLIGASFSGWAQELAGQEKAGYWYAFTESDDELNRDLDGMYPNYSPDDSIKIEGVISEIEYFGILDDCSETVSYNRELCEKYPVIHSDLGAIETKTYKTLEEQNIDYLFPSHISSEFNESELGINFASDERYTQINGDTGLYFGDDNVSAAVFTDVVFENILFHNVDFTDTFFVDCTFERVSFYNVTFTKSVFSNSSFDVVLFNNVSVDSSRFEDSQLDRFLVRESEFNNTNFDKTNIRASKWSYSSLDNGIFQRSSMDIVIFRSLNINDFIMVLSSIKNNIDAPETANFNFTMIKIDDIEIRVPGDVVSQYPVGAQLHFGEIFCFKCDEAEIKLGGEAAGVAGTQGGWLEGDITGEGFRLSQSTNFSLNLNHEYITIDNVDIKTTIWWNILFNAIAFLGFGVLVYAIGGKTTIMGLFKFFSPFLMTAGFFSVMYVTMSQKDFLNLSRLMVVYFVPPFGKGTVIPGGIALGLNPWSLAVATAFVDIAVGVFLTWNFDLAKKIPFIGSGITRIQNKGKAMLTSLPWLERASVTGIIVFVMFPFQGSGAVGGTILGRAIGISPNKNLAAVSVGAISGSFLLSASIVYGLGVLAVLAPIQVAVAVLFAGLLIAIYFTYQHWDDINLEDMTQSLGLHKEGLIGAPLNAAGGMVGSAGGTVLKVAGDTGKSVVNVAGDTGKMITKTTGDLMGSFVGTFTDEQYDFADENTPMELESGVLVAMPENGAKRRVIVTGGAGFIGSHLVDRLVKRDEHVVVLDNFSSGELEFLYESIEQITLIDVDLLKDDFDEHLKGAKIVYHLAANPEVQLGITKPEVMQEQNVDVTERVLEAMKRTGCDRIVFTSTSTVYGDAEKIPTPESAPLEPISAYGSSKLDAEKIIEKYCKEEGFRGVSYRFANCVGPRSNHGVTYDFVHKLKDQPEVLEILGDGTQHKSYFHVEDCISAVLAKNPGELCEKGDFVALNVGSKDAIDVVTLADEVCKAMKLKDVGYKFTGGVDGGRGWKGDVKKMRLDIKAMKSHGWSPNYTSRKAILETAKWLDDNY